MNKRYCEYFSIKKDYNPCMSKDEIQTTPEKWLDYYPHKTFIDILRELLGQLDGGKKSIWITGAYGTGKTHCALVLQKLFNDDESRVLKYFDNNNELSSLEEIKQKLLLRRNERTLVVFDSGSAGVDPTDHFLVRIEKSIVSQLHESGYQIPLRGNIEKIKTRIEEEGSNFFKTRDFIQSKLSELTPNIRDYYDLEKVLNNASDNLGALLSDIAAVLRERGIYWDLSAESLKCWIENVCKLNGISRIIFIWDEFSEFLDKNKSQLTTMQEVAHMAGKGIFFFVPVTHLEVNAFAAAGSDNANKVKDRFEVKNIDMPIGTALKFAAKALNVNQETSSEWEKEHEVLWGEVKFVADTVKSKFQDVEDIKDFKKLLPIHPMTIIVLKQLAVATGSNQRSLFSFMAKSQEFRDFINNGGVDVWNKQYLTIDYLWEYFVENRNDLGTPKEIIWARSEFLRHKERIVQEEDKRVFKTILLLKVLSDKWDRNSANELLFATIDNIKLSFRGDGIVYSNIDTIIERMKSEHCFNVINGKIEPFGTTLNSDDIEKKKEAFQNKFYGFVLEEKTQSKLKEKLSEYNYGNRYDIRCCGVKETTASNVKNRDSFGVESNKILMQFVLAKDESEQLGIIDKINDVLTQLSSHRVIFVTLDTTFCSQKADMWDTYIDQLARFELANDNITKDIHKKQIVDIEERWKRQIMEENRRLTLRWCDRNENIKCEEIVWRQLKEFMVDRRMEWFEYCIEDISDYNLTAFSIPSALQLWAEAGILLDGFINKYPKSGGAQKRLVEIYSKKGITAESTWFKENPQMPLTKMRDFCKERLDNTVGRGTQCSIRKIYIDLQRPPYGLLNIPYSAFVLGFVLKDFINDKRNLQWTDGTNTRKLDVSSLAEIIESVVKNNGEDKIKNEKMICRISKEEKKFIESCPKMFGMEIAQEANVEALLSDLASRIQSLCNDVPLWILPEYINGQQIKNSQIISEIIENLCFANSISSKGNTEDRGNAIKKIGGFIIENPNVVEDISDVLKPENIEESFRHFVDIKKPNLKQKAIEARDLSGEYYKSIKSKFAQTASWLWKPQDVEPILEEVSSQYDIILAMRALTGVSGYMPFDDAIERLRKAIFEDNKVSIEVWRLNYPLFGRIFELMHDNNIPNGQEVVTELSRLIKDQFDDLKEVFFDLEQKRQVNIAKQLVRDVWSGSTPKEDREIYAKFEKWAKCSEDNFKSNAIRVIEEHKDLLATVQRKKIWQEKQPQIKDKVEKISEKKAKEILLKLAEKNPQEILRLLEES